MGRPSLCVVCVSCVWLCVYPCVYLYIYCRCLPLFIPSRSLLMFLLLLLLTCAGCACTLAGLARLQMVLCAGFLLVIGRAGGLLGGNPVGLAAAARTGKFQLCNPCRCI